MVDSGLTTHTYTQRRNLVAQRGEWILIPVTGEVIQRRKAYTELLGSFLCDISMCFFKEHYNKDLCHS